MIRRRHLGVAIASLQILIADAAIAGTALYDASFVMHTFIGGVPMPIAGAATGHGTIETVATGAEPAPVALPQSAFGVTAAAYWAIYPPTTFYSTYATFVNRAGGFFAGGGPAAGKGTVTHQGDAKRVGSWVIREGANGFGGTLGLLGKQGAFAQFQIKTSGPSVPLPGTFVGTSSWNMIRALGRSPMDPSNPYTNTGMFTNEIGSAVTTYTKFATGTPWTTGTVTVVASVGSYSTVLRRSGYDKRTAGGARTIQLVTPTLTHWKRNHGRPFNHTAQIAVLRIRLVPEPSALAMLGAGFGALLLVGRASRFSERWRDRADGFDRIAVMKPRRGR